jgi:protein TonB
MTLSMTAQNQTEAKKDTAKTEKKPKYVDFNMANFDKIIPAVYPGCEDTGDFRQMKKCFNAGVIKVISQNFNADLPNTLGLSPGKKRMIFSFKVNPEGELVIIGVQAPHPTLKEEGMRILKLLPKKMKPARKEKSGEKVDFKITLPMRIEVQ